MCFYIMKKYLALVSVLLLSACATQIMEQHVGSTLSEPVMKYGPPTYSYNVDATTRAFVWTNAKGVAVPGRVSSGGSDIFFGNGAASPMNGGSPYGETLVTPTREINAECSYTYFARKAVAQPQTPGDWVVTSFKSPTLLCE